MLLHNVCTRLAMFNKQVNNKYYIICRKNTILNTLKTDNQNLLNFESYWLEHKIENGE